MAKGKITKKFLEDLYLYLDTECATIMCDNTLKLTRQWIKENNLSDREEEIIKYLEDHGGYCDCEVIYNVFKR